MAYSVTKDALVPMLARNILKHGSLASISEFTSGVRDRGGDVTVTEEFIALAEIRKYDDADAMIRAAFESAVSAYSVALDEANQKNEELRNLTPKNRTGVTNRRPFLANSKYIFLWFAVVGGAAWMDEENFSATLSASVVVAGTGLLCFLAFLSNRDGYRSVNSN